MIDKKTFIKATIINAACILGVVAAGGSEEQLEAASRFACSLGLAFQIRDDMLDVIGDAKELGKATGVDGTKNTFVQLYGLEKCDDMVKEHTNQALEAISIFGDCEFMKQLALQLTNRFQ